MTPIDPPSAATNEWQQDPHIEISFDKLPRTSHGLVFGCHFASDIVLPNLPGVSAFHFCITFDEERRLIVKDLNSSGGTQITFNEMERDSVAISGG